MKVDLGKTVGQHTVEVLRDVYKRGNPAWLWDAARCRMIWATEAAVLFWTEPTLLDLIERTFGPDETSVQQMQHLCAGMTPGDEIHQRLRFNPDNHSVWALCKLTSLDMDGRPYVLVDVEQIEETPAEDPTTGDITLAQEAPVPLSLYALDGQLIHENRASQELFGAHSDLMRRLENPVAASKFILRVLSDGAFSRTYPLSTAYGIRLHRFVGRRIPHPAQSVPAIMMHVQDVHDTRKAWQDVGKFAKTNPSPAQTSQASSETEPAATDHSPQKTDDAWLETDSLDSYLDAIPGMLFTLTKEGLIIGFNRATRLYLEQKLDQVTRNKKDISSFPAHSADDLIGYTFSDLFSEDLKGQIEQALQHNDGTQGEPYVLQNCNGEFAAHSGLSGPVSLSLGSLSHHNTQQFYAALHDLSDQQDIQGHLIRAHDQAQERDQQKLEFLAKVSHEMRTPLNAILGFTEIMKDERLGDIENTRYKEYITDVHKSSEFLLSLVNDLLSYAKAESGNLKLHPEDVALDDTILSIMQLLSLTAQKHNITLHIDLDNNLPHIVADERSIRQILLNLLSNAINYSDRGDEIFVSAKLNGHGSVVVEIRDTGLGMSEDDLVLALEPFQSASSAKKKRTSNNNHESTGLGLPLAKSLTEANKAEFAITSALKEGTCITLTFPSTLVLLV